MRNLQISIIGLGKLGSPMVAAYASKGYKVIGLDINPDFVHLINEGKPPVFETKLAGYLAANKERIFATQDYNKAILESDITFIIVPTPSRDNGNFSTDCVVETGKKIGEVLKRKKNFHLVVLTSTVTPGSTEKNLLPILEEYSGKKCGQEFGLCYNPEFIALGSVIDNLLNPDFILIGEFDSHSGKILESFYNGICHNNTPIKKMNIVNAEIAKIALNTYVTAKISYANMLAELCERIPGANVDIVTDVLGCDARIGHKYLKGAIGYSGPCFPRDNRALIYTAKKFEVLLPLAEATDKINQNQVPRLIKLILSVLPQDGKIGILGLSYKPDTNVIEESQSLKIAKILSEKGIKVFAYDPVAIKNAKQVLNNKVIFASSFKECVRLSDVVVIVTPWPEFKNIQPNDLKKQNGEVVLIDCWRLLDADKFKGVAKYIPLGINLS